MSNTVVPLTINPSAEVISDAASPTQIRSATQSRVTFPQAASTLERAPSSPTLFLPSPAAGPVSPVPEIGEIVVLADGTRYAGASKDGKAEGRGKAIFPPDNVLIDYEGEFANGLAHGEGTVRFREGGTYTGQMHEGRITGTGTLTYRVGNRTGRLTYKGELLNTIPHGSGVMRYRDGSTYSGCYQNGVWEGQGKYRRPNGSCAEGIFKGGRLWNGTKSIRTERGDTITITINNGQRVRDCSCVIL